MKLKIALFVTLFAALFIALPVQARPVMEKGYVPFKANVSAYGTPPPQGAPPWYMDIFGSGVATHMGLVTVYQHHWIAPVADSNDLVFYDGVSIWTAANGDILDGTYYGRMVFNPVGGYFEIHGHFVFDGGTGRFKDAQGAGLASGIQRFDGTADLRLDGTIKY
jgi:hypothetical protein